MANAVFDQRFKLVTSDVLSPLWLACIRLLMALYTLIVLLVILIWEALKKDGSVNSVNTYFSYFTNLSYIGICAYFFASGVQTYAYAKNVEKNSKEYPLQRWPRILQYLHTLLLSTVVTFPMLVTIVYWIILSTPTTFETPYSTWSNISKHLLNTLMAVFEIASTNIGPLPWIDLPVTVLILGAYLGVAYITHATQGIYLYSFLDPQKQGKLLAAYIIGLAVGQCLLFLVVRTTIYTREWGLKLINTRRGWVL